MTAQARRGGMMGWWRWMWLGMVLVWSGCATVEPPAPPPEEPVVEAPTPEEQPPAERWILVRKTDRTLILFEGDQVLHTYPIVLGKSPYGPKLYQGDQRTPEGEYHITRKYYHPNWSRFMLLDYPTDENREVYAFNLVNGLIPARDGHNPGIGGSVGIHGTKDPTLNRVGLNWTQ